LNERGLASRRSYEVAVLQYNQMAASENKARADLNAERNNRLALLKGLSAAFSSVADFYKVASSGQPKQG